MIISPDTMVRNGKRVLFINPSKDDNFTVNRVHMGLSLLGDILLSKGHFVRIIDYAFLKCVKDKICIPSVEEAIRDFCPDVIGISVFTYLFDETRALIDRITRYCKLPLILGGPHLTLFPEDFAQDERISYLVVGEAEKVISDVVQTAKVETSPVIIKCPLPSADEIPSVNLEIVYGSNSLTNYQIQLSRGCPYGCTFCNVKHIAGRKIRARDLEVCLKQIIDATRNYPSITDVVVTDDCPTFDKERFKLFLRMFADAKTGCRLWIDNLRANLVDEEMVELYKQAGGINMCLGVESGDPAVFQTVNKGESLEDITRAASIIKKHGLLLGLCFVIGLPHDDLRRHKNSMRFAKSINPDYIFWNMCIPWPKTELYQWFQANGEIQRPHNFSTLIDPSVNFRDPVCSSPDFTKRDRIKAWLWANMSTHKYFTSAEAFPRLVSLSIYYRLYGYALLYLFKYLFSPVQRFLVKCRNYFIGLGQLLISMTGLLYAATRNLPGISLDIFGRLLAVRLMFRTSLRKYYEMLLNPVSSVRYFEFQFVKNALSDVDTASVLDISSPRLLPFWLALKRKFQVTMINPDKRDLDLSRQIVADAWPDMSTEQLSFGTDIDATNLPFGDDSFDVVTSISVLEHIPDDEDITAVSEMWRVLKPGGRLIITVPCAVEYLEESRDSDIYGLGTRRNKGKHFFQRYYDHNAIRTRLIAVVKSDPSRLEIFGERIKGVFSSYEKKWIQFGIKETIKDAFFISRNFEYFPAMDAMPGMGICALVFKKPDSSAENC